ncbi:flagellar biosynthetic protein FliO [Thermosipho ferrireducens]|uniref:flagellar biosynthetic protein FliO n=1 Tax=Thermosipho ferrireducens TaxID=2571116 RepID=UPI001D18C0FE|nr:flagellar biosynthetic protein FliO [Thermosipho ferrireducens]
MIVKRKFPQTSGGRFVSIIERKYITKNSCVAVVRIGDDYYALLITENGGNIIKKFDTVESGELEEVHSFRSEFFKKLTKKGEKK